MPLTARSRVRLGAIGAFLGAVASTARIATAAEHARVALTYERGLGTEVCPDQHAFRAEVSARLGYDGFRRDAERAIHVSLARVASGFQGVVRLVQSDGTVSGERELDGQSCDELIASLAVAAAVAVDPSALQPSNPTVSNPPKAAPLGAPSAPPIRARTDPSTSDEQSTRVAVLLGGVASFGTAPAGAAGAQLAVELRRAWLSVALEARADAPAGRPAPRGEVSSSVLLVQFVPCARLPPLLGCAVGAMGALRGEGRGVELPASASAPFASAGLRFGLELPIGDRFGLRMHGQADVPLTRVTLRIDGVDAWRTPPVVLSVGVSALALLP